jgi:hypothetical protein
MSPFIKGRISDMLGMAATKIDFSLYARQRMSGRRAIAVSGRAGVLSPYLTSIIHVSLLSYLKFLINIIYFL